MCAYIGICSICWLVGRPYPNKGSSFSLVDLVTECSRLHGLGWLLEPVPLYGRTYSLVLGSEKNEREASLSLPPT